METGNAAPSQVQPRVGDAGPRGLGRRVSAAALPERGTPDAQAGPRSVILPYRGGGEEPRILLGFCETVMRSDIDELVIGIDRDECEYPEIEKVRGLYGDRVRVVKVPASPEWGSRFAAVLWQLIASARHDLVLVTNVDELPSKRALGSPHKAGRMPGYVLESGAPKRGGAPVLPYWTGTFWLWRPALCDYFDLRLYKRIRDGGDLFFFWSAVKAGLRYHRQKGPWITIHGAEHGDLGWCRWKEGIRVSAHAQKKWGGIAAYRRAARNLVCMLEIVRRKKDIWHLAGWLAGMTRPNSYWATMARTLHVMDWVHQGRLPYDDLVGRWWRRAPSREAIVAYGHDAPPAGSP